VVLDAGRSARWDREQQRRVSDDGSFDGGKRLLGKVASLLGDKETSDMGISVVDKDEKEIGNFPCHSAILVGTISNILT